MVLLNKRQRLFTAEDDARIIDLKENQQMTWAQIATFFQGRSRGTLQVHYSRALKGRNEPGLSGTAIECKLEAVEDINSLRSTSPPSRLCLQRAAKVKRLQILAPDIGHGVLSKSNTNDVAAKTFTEALPVPAGSATEDRRHVRSTALAEPEHLPKRSSKRKSQAIQAPTSKSRSTRRVSNRMATEEMSRVTGSIGAAAVKTTDPELEGATTSRDNMMTTRRANKAGLARESSDRETSRVRKSRPDSSGQSNVRRQVSTPSARPKDRWVRCGPLSPSDRRFGSTVPRHFTHPPPTRVIEYHTGSGSFRTRRRRFEDQFTVGYFIVRGDSPSGDYLQAEDGFGEEQETEEENSTEGSVKESIPAVDDSEADSSDEASS